MRVLAFSSFTVLDNVDGAGWHCLNCVEGFRNLRRRHASSKPLPEELVAVAKLNGDTVLSEWSAPANATVGDVMEAVIAAQNSSVRFPYAQRLVLGGEVLGFDTTISDLKSTSPIDLHLIQLPEEAMKNDPEDADRLIAAAEEEDVAKVKAILRDLVHPNAVGSDDTTALYMTALYWPTGFDVVKALVEAGGDVSQVHGSLLHFVGYRHASSSFAKVQFLCEHGADVSKTDNGETVLEFYQRKTQDPALSKSARDEVTKSLQYLQSVAEARKV